MPDQQAVSQYGSAPSFHLQIGQKGIKSMLLMQYQTIRDGCNIGSLNCDTACKPGMTLFGFWRVSGNSGSGRGGRKVGPVFGDMRLGRGLSGVLLGNGAKPRTILLMVAWGLVGWIAITSADRRCHPFGSCND